MWKTEMDVLRIVFWRRTCRGRVSLHNVEQQIVGVAWFAQIHRLTHSSLLNAIRFVETQSRRLDLSNVMTVMLRMETAAQVHAPSSLGGLCIPALVEDLSCIRCVVIELLLGVRNVMMVIRCHQMAVPKIAE
jgi:hypothetical protein